MSSLKIVRKETIVLENIAEKLRERGIDAQICKRPKMINILTEEKINI